MKNRFFLKSVSLAILSAMAIASVNLATASSLLEHIKHVTDITDPHNAAMRTNRKAQQRSTEAGLDGVATQGDGAYEPSFFLDYTFINTQDDGRGVPSGDTHSGAFGIDVLTPADILVGLIYSYSETSLNGPAYDSDSASNFLTAYASKSIQPWLQVGITLGVGDTDNDQIPNGTQPIRIENGTWTTSPFVSVLYANGSLFASSTLAYQLTQVGGSGQHSMTWETNVGYALTDSLSVVGLIRFFQEMESEIDSIDDDNYTVLGGKVHYALGDGGSVYTGVEFDVWNETYDTFTALVGYSRPF